MFAAAAVLLAAQGVALAQDAIHAPAQKPIGAHAGAGEMVPSLAVINSRGAALQGNVLTMTDVSPNSIVFADRPVRSAGHVLTRHFLKEWDEGSDSFAKDPPNATISVLGADGGSVKDAVVILKSPKLDDDKLTFEVSVLEGDLSGAEGPASLFIDWFSASYAHAGGFGHVGGYGYGHVGYAGGYAYHPSAWHGAWYGAPGAAAVAGAAVGAAAVGAAAADAHYHPYYAAPPPPSCGYYPYPPCY
jgi:hypothetical protein